MWRGNKRRHAAKKMRKQTHRQFDPHFERSLQHRQDHLGLVTDAVQRLTLVTDHVPRSGGYTWDELSVSWRG